MEELFVFETFEELYKKVPLEECGYVKQELSKAKADDMLQYYSVDKQKQYGVVGIKVKFI